MNQQTGIEQAIEDWNDYLRKQPPDPEQRSQRLKEMGFWAAERPLCSVARPLFVSKQRFQEDARVCELFISAIEKAGKALRKDNQLAKLYWGKSYEIYGAALAIERGYELESIFGRLDAYRDSAGDLRFLEYNAGMAGGLNFGDELSDYFEELPWFEEFRARHPVTHYDVLPVFLQALQATWEEWGGEGRPRITTVLPRDAYGYKMLSQSFYAALRFTQAQGYDADIADPRDFVFDGKQLLLEGRPVQIMLRAFMLDELGEARQTLMDALQARAVCMVNPFSLNGHKAVFGLLSDGENDLGLTAEERQVIDRHVPWTRLVREVETSGLDGKRVDLVKHALENQQRLVLKAGVSQGGKDVVLGWNSSPEVWDQTLKNAVADGSWILQDRLELVSDTFPWMSEGFPEVEVHTDTCPLIVRGRLAGYLTRLGPGEIINVSTGSSLAPTFCLESP